ncbi:MAG: hypothetical protein E7454_00580 [Ruminococcaceae bacterium]|nr:hypothetical protein [Oscillospiraceae bacterium]
MKTLKWIGITVLLAMLTVVAINGSLGDQSSDGKHLCIVQSELDRSGSGLTEVADDRKLLPVTDVELKKQAVQLTDQFIVTDKKNHTVNVNLSVNADLYTVENVLDHIVVITNAGNHIGYVRTWFAFEMGNLTEDEFKASVLLNQNSAQWTWGEFTYGVQIGGVRYAVVCAKYNTALDGGATTSPNLLQILLKSDVANDTANRLDGNHDGKYEVRAYSQVVSDDGAWSQVSKPWNME